MKISLVVAIVTILVLSVDVIPILSLERDNLKNEVAVLKHEHSQTVAQQQLTEWMADLASASSFSLIVNSKPGASVDSHIVGLLWPKDQERSIPWLVEGDLTAYNWFSGPMQQYVALRNGSGHRWAMSEAGTENLHLNWCIQREDMPDLSEVKRLNESVSLWTPAGEEATSNNPISLGVVYNGESYKITATRNEKPSISFRVESSKLVMVLVVEQNPSDRSMLKHGGVKPNCPQLFDAARKSR